MTWQMCANAKSNMAVVGTVPNPFERNLTSLGNRVSGLLLALSFLLRGDSIGGLSFVPGTEEVRSSDFCAARGAKRKMTLPTCVPGFQHDLLNLLSISLK